MIFRNLKYLFVRSLKDFRNTIFLKIENFSLLPCTYVIHLASSLINFLSLFIFKLFFAYQTILHALIFKYYFQLDYFLTKFAHWACFDCKIIMKGDLEIRLILNRVPGQSPKRPKNWTSRYIILELGIISIYQDCYNLNDTIASYEVKGLS